ncbi:hypothetical protein T235_06520 [Tannerella sp. oral taxon BU063 isolate Cell 8/11]|uniref:Uncharacterized protein n=1 Tax=Tannerella sp. oral taxon BU063 isolate Cell 8/11 TaxID=1411915 RepID=W2D0D6_9BACT|nr:hypothetical protein T235_06520 [Tannerella sp. oral taxon BU063 isolate Cell 8/11]
MKYLKLRRRFLQPELLVEDSLSLENQIAYRNKTPDFTLCKIGCKLYNVLIIDVCCGMDGL